MGAGGQRSRAGPGRGGSVDNATKTPCLIPICSATVTRFLLRNAAACSAWVGVCVGVTQTSWSKLMRNSSGQSHHPRAQRCSRTNRKVLGATARASAGAGNRTYNCQLAM